MEKIRELSGVASVYSGNKFLAPGEFSIDVYQEFIEERTLDGPSRVPGIKRIVGFVRGPFPMASILKLVTAQGHTLEFFITGSDGAIAAAGPLLTQDGTPMV